MAATNTDMHMLQERPAAHHIPQHQPSSPSHSLSSPSLVESIRSLRDDSTRPHNVPATADEQHQIRARRKPVPSPLYPAGNNGLSYQQLSYQDSPRFDEPRSPREKLDALLAEEQHHTSPIRPTKPAHPPTPPNVPTPNFTQPSRPSAYAKLRQVSSPTLSSAGISPPASPVTMPPPSRPNRPETRPTVPVRNPSIDSAASSLSSTASQNRPPANHATRPSQDTSTANPPDMAALIATAGSPEAAMLALWKEKQNISSHNAQLWRLVEKQRSMIIGLQKDLERALKDKDRYRRKFKEYAEQVPPGPGSLQKSDTFDSVVERETSQSPALSEPAGEPARPSDSKAGEHKTSPLTQEHPAPHLIPDSQLATSPSHSTASNLSSAVNSPTDYSVQPLSLGSKGLGLDATLLQPGDAVQPPEQASKPTTPPQNNSDVTIVPSDSQLQPPQISLIQATPVIGGDGFESPPRKTPQPLRKAPPAPLNLSKPITTSAHLHQAVHGDDVDSDYDDTLEVDEIPIVELRGRRKTREEDDRVREAMYSKDEEARSKSKKKKSESKSKQQATPSETPADDQPQAVPVPLSPRQFNALQSGLPLSPRHPPANSLNALLSPANSDSSMMANRSVASPLMSPGLPSSPRPTDRPLGSPLPRNPKQSIASPPMSPTTTSQSAGRPVQHQVPLPPNTPQSYQSPPVNQSQHSNQLRKESSTGLLTVPGAQPSPESPSSSPTLNDVPDAEHVYRGLVSDQYPGLLLPPNALPSIQVKVFSSRLRPSRMSMLAPKPQEEDPVFILAVYARSDNKQLWRVEKTIATLPSLDSQLRSMCDFQGQLPDRGLFGGHAPAKIDARRVALNQYFDTVLETPMNEKTALIVCEYLSTDVIGAQAGDRLAPEPTPGPTVSVQRTQRKVGYLTKRGKNFGGWKARFFVLDGSEFRYFEGEGGAHLGTIKLQNAQIGKQSQQQSNQSPQRKDDSEDNQYRHAFLILEPKRKDSTSLVRHVLCAENDEERDAWVEALLQHVDIPDETSPIEIRVPSATRLQKQQASQDSTRSQRRDSPDVAEQDRLQGLSYDDAVQAQAPVRGPNHRDMMVEKASRGSPKESSFHQDNSGHYPAISGPSNGTPIKDSESWGSKLMAGPTAVKDKKRSIFGFRGRGGSSDLAPVQISTPLQSTTEHRLPPGRSVFGIPLMEAVEFTQPDGVNVAIPAVVYRCLEYLRAKKAISEEGIFRLSGSNIVIKGLRDRFNNEGDIKLLDGQYYDVHAVASLLKLYLRELPASVLTRELHLDFLKVLDMDERSKKIQSFNVLVHKLPRPNFELLRHLASFLIEIVDNSGVNKMTVRNVGIVFAPTLNIPAPLISFFLTDYTDIFGAALDEASSPIHEIRNNTSHLGDDAIRSPRRQMFSDLPTPAYNETTFQQRMDRPPQGYQGNSAPNYPPPQPPQQYQQQQQQQYSNQQQQGQYSGYDSGFIPMRPSYDTPAYDQPYNSGEGYGSLNGVVQSSGAREQRQRKRESGMLLMNMGMGGQRKGSGGPNAQQRGDGRYDPRMYSQNNTPNPLMVREETAFD